MTAPLLPPPAETILMYAAWGALAPRAWSGYAGHAPLNYDFRHNFGAVIAGLPRRARLSYRSYNERFSFMASKKDAPKDEAIAHKPQSMQVSVESFGGVQDMLGLQGTTLARAQADDNTKGKIDSIIDVMQGYRIVMLSLNNTIIESSKIMNDNFDKIIRYLKQESALRAAELAYLREQMDNLSTKTDEAVSKAEFDQFKKEMRSNLKAIHAKLDALSLRFPN